MLRTNKTTRLVLSLLIAVTTLLRPEAGILISEFVAANTTGYLDEDKQTSDWLELFNDSASDINLQGWFLTDSSSDLRKWQFPSTNLLAGSNLVLFASSKDRRVPGRPLHANFSLDPAGEYLALVRPDGRTVEFEYTPRYPAQYPDISHGIAPETSNVFHYFSPPTPTLANTNGAPAVAPEPEFSLLEGVYTNDLEIALSSSLPNSKIYYTINGTEPSTSSLLYTNTIKATNSVVVRARVFADNFILSPTRTRTFWIAGPDALNFSSNLPIVIFSSFGRGLSESTRTPVSMRLLDKGANGRAFLRQSETDFKGRATLRIRGSSSTQFPKKSFALELTDEKGDDQPASLLGLSVDSDWIMYAPYTDKTLMRDVLAYELSNRIGRYAPRTRFVEVYVDVTGKLTKSDYVGVYVLIEKLTRNKERIDIDELLFSQTSEPEISGGYILKNDRLDPGDVGFSTTLATLCYVDPKEREMPVAQRSWIRNWLISFENALRSSDYRNPATGYKAYVDSGSFIDHHLLVEMAKNIDGYRLSTYMYKPRGGKLVMGPIWDYNLTFGNANYLDGSRTNGWYHVNTSGNSYPWYALLFRDPDFTQAYADRWAEIRRSNLTTDLVLARVDQMAAELQEAQVRNYERWRILGTYVWPNQYIGKTYADEVNWMKQWIRGRFAWMDNAFLRTPALNKPGGEVLPGFLATLQAGTNAIYYTLDGSDPRLPGGAISPKAIRYTEGLVLQQPATIFARTRSTNLWSAPTLANFTFIQPDPAWLAWYFSQAELGDPRISGSEADPDGDRLSNLQEFLAATDPRNSEDSLRLTAKSSGVQLELQFQARAGKSYVLQARESSENSPWVDLRAFTAPADQVTVYYEEPKTSSRFFRLVLTLN